MQSAAPKEFGFPVCGSRNDGFRPRIRQLGKISFGNLARFHSATWRFSPRVRGRQELAIFSRLRALLPSRVLVSSDQFPVAIHASSIVLAIDPDRGICGRCSRSNHPDSMTSSPSGLSSPVAYSARKPIMMLDG